MILGVIASNRSKQLQDYFPSGNAASADTNEANATTGWSSVSGATVTSDATEFDNGSYSIKIVSAADSNSRGEIDVTGLNTSQEYEIRCRIKVGTGSTQMARSWANCTIPVTEMDGGLGWTWYYWRVTPTASTITMRFYPSNGGVASEEMWVDNITITKSEYTTYTEVDITSLAYATKSKDITAQLTSTGYGIRLADTKLFAWTAGDIYQYSHDTSDISNITYDTVTYSWSGSRYGVCLNDDGTSMYTVSSDELIQQLTLNTAYSLSSVTDPSISFDASNETTVYRSIRWSYDGRMIFATSNVSGNYTIYRYDASTPFDLSTVTYSGFSFATGSAEGPWDIWISRTGLTMLIIFTDSAGSMREFTMTEPYNFVTVSQTNNIGLSSFFPVAFDIDEVNSKMYMMGYARIIQEYTY